MSERISGSVPQMIAKIEEITGKIREVISASPFSYDKGLYESHFAAMKADLEPLKRFGGSIKLSNPANYIGTARKTLAKIYNQAIQDGGAFAETVTNETAGPLHEEIHTIKDKVSAIQSWLDIMDGSIAATQGRKI